MTRGMGSPFVEGLKSEILRFAQDDRAIYVYSAQRSSVVYSAQRSSVRSASRSLNSFLRRFPAYSPLQFPTCSKFRQDASQHVQQTPYKRREEWSFRAQARGNAYWRETLIKMSVLAKGGSSSFHR